ncbi:hypothetical protein SH501x_000869 [Pirellulaceae bacterium SH501]
MKIEYTITIIGNEARVTKPGLGYCDSFHGPTSKADAIRYVLKRGGSFKFEDFKG